MTKQETILKLEKELSQLENLMEESINAGESAMGYVKAISKLETKIWKLETAVVN